MRRITKFSPKKPIPFLRNFTQIPYHHQEPIPLSSPNPQVALLNLCNNISTLKITHSLLLVHNLTNDTHTQTKLLSKYASFGNINSARLIFNQIQYPDLFSFRIMIRWYFLNDLYEELILFYRYLRKCLNETDNIVFSIVLKACKELRDVDEGKKVHGVIVKVGSPDGFVLTGLEDLYAKCGEIEYARVLFDESPERNVVSWSSMIAGYVQNDLVEDGLVLFNQMRADFVEPNEVTLGSLLTACTKMGALHQGRWIHGFMIKTAIIVNSFVASTLLDMYVKRGRTVDEARALFDELKGFELVPWTTMIVGYTHRNLPYEALKLFADERWAHVLPNSVTIANVLSACAVVGDLNLGKNIHCVGKKLGLEDSPVENALVHMYAKCGMIRDASYIFEMIDEKDVVAWNSMIAGYFQNGFTQEGVALFRQMTHSYTLDAVTLVSVLSAYTTLSVLWVGSAVHAYALQLGFLSSNVYVGTALLNFYSKCGDWESARRVFDEIKEKSKVTWCSMMAGCGMHGDSSGSIALLGEMMKEKLEPNEVIFTTILSACSHSGNIGEGWKYFNSMCKEHRLVPSMKHYVCMIDLLARAGRLEEAFDFIERMPIEPDTRIWGALLHGCQLHSRLDLVEVAVRKMIELQPDTASYYVLMSNLYASDGRWEQVNEMRELMKKQGLSKTPGCSELEMDKNDDFPALAESACG